MSNKEIRSYTVFRDSTRDKLTIKGSHWQPGYTPAYCATPLEAIEYEESKALGEISDQEDRLELLDALRNELKIKTDRAGVRVLDISIVKDMSAGFIEIKEKK